MAQLTLTLFSLDPHQLHNKTSAQLFAVLLPQLAVTRPYVNAAAGALGAAYDKCILRRAHHQDDKLITRLYLSALRQVQDELQGPEPEVVPLLIAALLLAAAESVQQKQRDALCHLLGAFSMITSPKSSLATSPGLFARNGTVEGLKSVQDVIYIGDYHVSMFAWGRSPLLPPLPVTTQMLYPACIDDLTAGHDALQQWGLHFIAKALEPEWEERIDFPQSLTVQQDYLIAWLKRWLRTYTSLFDNPSLRSSPHQTPHFRILKAQTLTMFVAVSNVKPPTQVTYDAYAPQFEDIIRCAEYVLSPTDPTNSSVLNRPLLPYSPLPGIIHPLFFTARKYRDSVSRRRAIHLLRQAGIEGPFHGDLEAHVAARIVEIEEDRRPFKSVLAKAEVLSASDIVDRNRVYMCWTLDYSAQDGAKRHKGDMARRLMKFSRRRRLAPVSRSTQTPADALDVGDGTLAHNLGVKVEPGGYEVRDEVNMWEVWEEVL
ncbi:hypothetical protein H2200_010525 [Cladophialophora chaetospira]|uniref:Zn(II)2Cys6 transcription factor n=1 Tax=Cladophialophora chaetospira TaxID=386627 RepID=A0AA39CE77_9EURO|nr:hypothetical protein H2200_010525 [Cladophialophora chaetospira]